KRRHELLEREPEDSVEKDYQDALHKSYNCEARLKMEVIGLHAAGVLNGIYCNRLHSQLAAQEEKEQNAKKKERQIDGGWLTKFYQRVVDHEKATEEEELAKEERRKTK
ncbi:hypothetical protein OG21DRAFT_1564719, partial [Imleria badia]